MTDGINHKLIVASEYWLMSLRGEGIRFVRVGNIFSGLFCPVKDDNNPVGEMIRR